MFTDDNTSPKSEDKKPVGDKAEDYFIMLAGVVPPFFFDFPMLGEKSARNRKIHPESRTKHCGEQLGRFRAIAVSKYLKLAGYKIHDDRLRIFVTDNYGNWNCQGSAEALMDVLQQAATDLHARENRIATTPTLAPTPAPPVLPTSGFVPQVQSPGASKATVMKRAIGLVRTARDVKNGGTIMLFDGSKILRTVELPRRGRSLAGAGLVPKMMSLAGAVFDKINGRIILPGIKILTVGKEMLLNILNLKLDKISVVPADREPVKFFRYAPAATATGATDPNGNGAGGDQ